MRLLVFEFITGGGLLNEPLPECLCHEGHLMRAALLEDLRSLSLSIIVLNDARISEPLLEGAVWSIKADDDLVHILQAKQEEYDAVWLITPETGGVLVEWQQFFLDLSKQVCLSSLSALKLCQDKLATLSHLTAVGLACVPSQEYKQFKAISGEWVLKPKDSVGCEQTYYLATEAHLESVLACLSTDTEYLLQPYIAGKVFSLSALFYQGTARFICCNQQQMQLDKQQFQLLACDVNVHTEQAASYQFLCTQIAQAIPELWGYIGIDFIETENGERLILEINPRLTSSYAGIKAATGINIAEQILALLDGKVAPLMRNKQQTIRIDIHKG